MGRHGLGSWDTITRGSRRYARFRITIDGRTIERVGASKKALEKEAESLRQRARRRLVTDDEEITLEAWALDRWLAMKRDELGAAGAKTLANYEGVLRGHVVPALGHVKVRDLRADHRRRLQRGLVAKGLKASTVNMVDGVLKACLKDAADNDLPVVVSVIEAVKTVKAAPAPKRTLAADQVEAILATSRDDAWHALWACFAYTGARDAEVRALRWRDVGDALLTIHRQLPQAPGDPPAWQAWLKGRKIERTVPIVPPLAAALRAHKARQNAARLALGKGMWSDYDLIFCDDVGRALRAQRVNDLFDAACRVAGIATWRGLGVHALRGAANEILREAGIDAPTRAQILGHTVAINEKFYVARNDQMALEALQALAKRLGGG